MGKGGEGQERRGRGKAGGLSRGQAQGRGENSGEGRARCARGQSSKRKVESGPNEWRRGPREEEGKRGSRQAARKLTGRNAGRARLASRGGVQVEEEGPRHEGQQAAGRRGQGEARGLNVKGIKRREHGMKDKRGRGERGERGGGGAKGGRGRHEGRGGSGGPGGQRCKTRRASR